MPHRLPAAILIQLNQQHPDKQEALCLEYAETSGLRAVALCHHCHDCLAVAMAGTVKAVITAVDPGGQLAEDLTRWSVQLHIVRQSATARLRRDVARLVERMHGRGLDTQEISQILEVDTREVRRSLFRAGIRPRPPSD